MTSNACSAPLSLYYHINSAPLLYAVLKLQHDHDRSSFNMARIYNIYLAPPYSTGFNRFLLLWETS